MNSAQTKMDELVDFSNECKELSGMLFKERDSLKMQDYPVLPFDWANCLQCSKDFSNCKTANLIRGMDAGRRASLKI